MVFTVLEAIYPSHDSIVLTSALFHAPLYLYVSYGMVRYVFDDEHVTSDEIYAVGAAFTVVAWAFAYVYSAAQVVWPGSFAGAGGPADQPWFDLLFLSFTTLTSTGLSDITPVLSHARSLSMVEQVTGVFYIASWCARIVALTVVRRRQEGHDRGSRDGGRRRTPRRGPGVGGVRVGGEAAARVAVEPDAQHYSASTMKLPILVAAHRRAERGGSTWVARCPSTTTSTRWCAGCASGWTSARTPTRRPGPRSGTTYPCASWSGG